MAVKELPASKRGFDPRVYMRIGHDQLVALALKFIVEEGKTPSFENLVEESFLSFPQRFSIEGHPEWPHALVVNRSIWRCRTNKQKRWISGTVAAGFKLTPEGETIAVDALQKLQTTKPLTKYLPKGGKQTASGRVVKHIEQSAAFEKFKRDRNLAAVDAFYNYLNKLRTQNAGTVHKQLVDSKYRRR